MNITHVIRTTVLAAAILLTTLAPASATTTASTTTTGAITTATGTTDATAAPTPVSTTALNQRPAVLGAQPFLMILCRFADAPSETEQPAYFTNLLVGPSQSLDDYWREVSRDQINLDGSQVAGWYALPKAEREYRKAGGGTDIAGAAADCIARAASSYDPHAYTGVVTVFNRDLESRPRGGRLCASWARARECFQVIWMWPAWLHSQAAWAHEMGHIFGLPHSSDASNGPYANPWDVMSGFCECEMPQYPIADQLRRLGWIPPARRFVAATSDGASTIELQPVAQRSERGHLMAQVPTEATERYYTIEARARLGYDRYIPGAAVLIHKVDTTDDDQPAHLVTHPGEPLTASAGMWRPGDVFTDTADRISISIDAAMGAGFRVTVRTGSAALSTSTIEEQRAGGRPGDTVGSLTGAISSQWTSGAPLLGLAAGASGSVYAVSAKATGLGMSPAIQASVWEGQTWQTPQTISSGWSSMPGDAPAIAVSRENAAFLAWSGASRPFPTMTSAPVNADIWLAGRAVTSPWATPVRLNDDTGPAMQLSPTIAVGQGGHVYAAWEDQRQGSRDIYFAELANGKPLGANRRINAESDAASQSSPAIAADSNGNVHLLWVGKRNGAGEIFAASRSANGTWGPNERLAVADLDVYGSPSITVDGRGNAYAAWIAYPLCFRAKGGTGTLMAAFKPVGGDWQAAMVVAEAVDGSEESRPVIAADEAGNVYLAWEERKGASIAIRLSRRTVESGWSAGQQIATTEAKSPSKPALAVDASGTLYLAWLTKDGNAEYLALAQAGR